MKELRDAIRAHLEDREVYMLPGSWVARLCDDNERLEVALLAAKAGLACDGWPERRDALDAVTAALEGH